MDYMTITGLNKYISESTWHVAKTMPGIPHSYVRKHEGDRKAFDALCRYIRAWGKDERFYSRTYRYLHLAGHKYWAMDEHCRDAILINRAAKPLEGYDLITGFVEMFADQESLNEDYEVLQTLKDNGALNGRVLDIGCGAGMIADRGAVQADKYIGIDPSFVQLVAFAERHPDFDGRLICAGIDEVNRNAKGEFDSVISTYGSASYAGLDSIINARKHLKPGGVEAHLFFKESYTPVTHIRTGHDIPYHVVPLKQLQENFDKVLEVSNFYIAISHL